MISLYEEYFNLSIPSSEYDFHLNLKDKEINNHDYLSIPWAAILNAGWQNLPINTAECLEKISKLRLKSAFTYNQHDDYLNLISLYEQIGLEYMFCPLHIKSIKSTIKILPIGNSVIHDFNPNRKKDILYSFIGTSASHHIRKVLFSKIKNPNIIIKDQYHFNDPKKPYEKSISNENYVDILERSIFSICPRGSSINSFRFWESLAAGAIPILIADDWLMPNFHWDDTILQIPERKIYEIGNLQQQLEHKLLSMTNNDIKTMYENCKKAYNYVKKENFYNYIKDYIDI